jgi:hypothetical protein
MKRVLTETTSVTLTESLEIVRSVPDRNALSGGNGVWVPKRNVSLSLEGAVALARCLMSIGPYPIAIQVARSKDESLRYQTILLKNELIALIA